MIIKNNTILKIDDLKTYFYTSDRIIKAVDGISFNLGEGEMLGIVGESGSGKSVTAYSAIRLIRPPGKIVQGNVFFNDISIMRLSEHDMRTRIRGKNIALIFQDPLSALNPSYKIGWQIMESITLHNKKANKKEVYEKAIDMLRKVQIPDPEIRIKNYPHQFSGGMRQRVLIAIALACNPKILFADEPTTALDVTIQAEIMDLLDELREIFKLSIIFISHDISLVAERCDRIIVMYSGRILEMGPSKEIMKKPLHPYTMDLINCLPIIDSKTNVLMAIKAEDTQLDHDISGCKYYKRCKLAKQECKTIKALLREVKPGHFSSCIIT